jgi:allantoate deiminase
MEHGAHHSSLALSPIRKVFSEIISVLLSPKAAPLCKLTADCVEWCRFQMLTVEAQGEAGRRAVARCDWLGVAPYSLAEGYLFRPYLSDAHAHALEMIGGWMGEAGMTVTIDPIGNLLGRYEGATADAPALLIGSHLDSVHDAGRYDGPLGVMLGIEAVQALHDAGRRLPFAIEVIGFGDEEGSRFPASMLSSRALSQGVDSAALDMVDDKGVTLRRALAEFGLDPSRAGRARRAPGEVFAYLEAHIEQGPVLETEGLAVGVVTAIAAQLRIKATFKGVAGHAGTTPMRLRHDSLAAAAQAVLAVERVCRETGGDMVGTVGRIIPSTGAFNVIVGATEIGIDLRAGDKAVRDGAAARLRTVLEEIAAERGVTVEIAVVQDLPGCPCDSNLADLLGEAVKAVGQRDFRLLSGAGHDAMVLADLAPVSMLFIRCAGGISHNAAESVDPADCGVAVAAMGAFVDRLTEGYEATL